MFHSPIHRLFSCLDANEVYKQGISTWSIGTRAVVQNVVTESADQLIHQILMAYITACIPLELGNSVRVQCNQHGYS